MTRQLSRAQFLHRATALGLGQHLRQRRTPPDGHRDRCVAVARSNFQGRITYGAAADLEQVDWSLFDLVGLDYYSSGFYQNC